MPYFAEELGDVAILFAVVLAAGFVAGKAGLLSKASKAGMTNLVLYVTLPCTIIMSFRIEYDSSLIRGFALTLLVAGVSQAIGQAASVIFFRKQPFEHRSVLRYGFIVCNSAFFGIAVISSVLHRIALPFAAIYLIPQRIAMWLLGVPVFSNDNQNRLKVVAQALVHPSMIAVYIGLFLFLQQIQFPAAIAAPIGAIGACTMPVSMILVGSILSDIKPSLLLDRYIYFYCMIRVVLIPGIIFLFCLVIGLNGAPFHVCVLMAAMPAASTTSLLALQYGADERLGSALLIISTIIFFVMLPVWMFLFSLVPS